MDVSESMRETYCHLPAPFKTVFPSQLTARSERDSFPPAPSMYSYNPRVHVELKFIRIQKPCRETLKKLHVLVLSAL